jgi:predicted alternative tryptophan synthase beta-subunit
MRKILRTSCLRALHEGYWRWTADPYVHIPGEVIDVYKLWRPTPLIRACAWRRCSTRPPGSTTRSHKPNTAVPQAYYNSVEETKRLTTETGAGQWGSSLAFASSGQTGETLAKLVAFPHPSLLIGRS